MRVRLFIINYCNNNLTYKFYKTICKEKVKIVILNNKCKKDHISYPFIIKDESNQLPEIINFDDNFGYFGAIYEYMKSNSDKYEWNIIANNDLQLLSNHLSDKINKIIMNDPNIGVIAPSIVELNNRELNPYFKHKPSLLKSLSFRVFFSNYTVAKFIHYLRRNFLKDKIEVSDYNNYIYSPNGAFMILNHEIFSLVFKSPPLSFLYGEEIKVTAIAESLNKKIYFTNTIKLLHERGASIGKDFSYFKFIHMKHAYKNSIKLNLDFFK